jgi:type VI secretion system Hcp family effector
VAIYMKYGSIEGDATQAGFEGWINVSHFDWQIQYTITNRAGLQHNTRDAKRPKIEEFTINKEVDGATTDLVAAICTSNKPETCTIAFVRTGGIDIPLIGLHIPEKFVEFQFNGTLITLFKTSAEDKMERPIETLKFNFTEFKFAVWSLDKENVTGGPKRFGPYSVPEDKPASGQSPGR